MRAASPGPGRRRRRSAPRGGARALVLVPALLAVALATGWAQVHGTGDGDPARAVEGRTGPTPAQAEPRPAAEDRAPEPGPQESREAPQPDPALPEGREVRGPDGEPVRVVVPAIGVDARLVRLGLEPNGNMEVPDFGLAGWYAEGPRPGHPGPSVIAAHVDSKSGPDVFSRLRELAPGDEVRVLYDSGQQATFVVRSPPVRTPKDALPGDDIWPDTDERRLTLVTCGGSFDRSTGHYRDNVIVYTEPAGTV